MILYLSALQALPTAVVGRYILTRRGANWRGVYIWQFSFLLLFWLVWGGYSTDAWKYLSRFDRDPFLFESERLFWIIGHYLGELFYDPWPLKILSAACAAILCWAYSRNDKTSPRVYYSAVVALLILLWVPGTYLLVGNVIRQGLASACIVLGLVYLSGGRRAIAGFLMVAAILFHELSFVLMVAAVVGIYLPRWLPALSVCLPLLGAVLPDMPFWESLNVESRLRYVGWQEGSLHYTKFLFAYGLSVFFIYSRRWLPLSGVDFRSVYIAMVALASLMLRYEVPFERLLLYSDFVLPLAIAPLLITNSISVQLRTLGLAAIGVFGSALWLLDSISASLGYLKVG